MSALYLDSSVVLRFLFRQPGYVDIRQTDLALASSLTEAECMRRLDRARLGHELPGAEITRRRAYLKRLLAEVRIIEVSSSILQRVGSPLPVGLGTLDAIHLITALQWREVHGQEVDFATHDRALAAAAVLYGFPVLGAGPPD